MDVPVQYFQSVITIELAVSGALLWQMHFFESTRRRRRRPQHRNHDRRVAPAIHDLVDGRDPRLFPRAGIRPQSRSPARGGGGRHDRARAIGRADQLRVLPPLRPLWPLVCHCPQRPEQCRPEDEGEANPEPRVGKRLALAGQLNRDYDQSNPSPRTGGGVWTSVVDPRQAGSLEACSGGSGS